MWSGSLHGNDIGPKGAEDLANGLRDCPTLQKL